MWHMYTWAVAHFIDIFSCVCRSSYFCLAFSKHQQHIGIADQTLVNTIRMEIILDIIQYGVFAIDPFFLHAIMVALSHVHVVRWVVFSKCFPGFSTSDS